ncbi:MAG: dihydropyrimidinase [Lacrimispora sp.]
MIVKGGTAVMENGEKRADIRVKDGVIVEIEENIIPEAGEESVDAWGCLVLPGGIDAHTHFDMPAAECRTSDDFFTGTRAAIMGGTTTIIDFAEFQKGERMQDGLDLWHEKADDRSYCDFGFHMTVPQWQEKTGEEIRSMIRQGITSFKAYTAYQDGIGVHDKELYPIMECIRETGALLCVHCENGQVLEYLQKEYIKKNPGDIRNHPLSRPDLVEKEAVSRVIDFAEMTGARVYIVHVSTREAEQVIRRAKERGVDIYGETCPQYLLLDESCYELPGFESAKYVLSPPLRKKDNQTALWQGLREGVLDTVSTDHCSFSYEEHKLLGKEDFTRIPNGIPGVEHRMELMLHYGEQQGMSPGMIVRVTAESPARIFGLYPRKGVIEVGSDGDLVVVEPDSPHVISARTQHQQVDYTPYEGFWVKKKIRHVLLRGQAAVKGGQLVQKVPGGRFLKREINRQK